MELCDQAQIEHTGLDAVLARLTDPVHWLEPAWAVACGVIASAGFGGQGEDWLKAALLALLVDVGWVGVWTALGSANWAAALIRWRDWQMGEPAAALPYTLSGSPGDRAARWLGQLRAWCYCLVWPAYGPVLVAAAVALVVAVALAAALGGDLVLLTGATLAVVQLGVAWEGGRGTVSPAWEGLVVVMLPWLAGHVAFAETLSLASAGLAFAFALTRGAAHQADQAGERALMLTAQMLVGGLLVLLRQPLAAGGVLFLLLPQLALLPWLRRGQAVSWYVRHSRPWLMTAMLVAAWAIQGV